MEKHSTYAIKREISVYVTVEELARIFCELDSDQQAEVFALIWQYRIGADSDSGRDLQSLCISNSVDKNEDAKAFREAIR